MSTLIEWEIVAFVDITIVVIIGIPEVDGAICVSINISQPEIGIG